MKVFVSKAISNCERSVQPRLTRRFSNASQHCVLAAAATSRRLSLPQSSLSPVATKFVEYNKSTNILSNAKSFSEINLDALPQEITWLSGAPGAGKGTNSKFISEICGYSAPTIVISSLLEQPEFKRIKDAGGIVDDAAVFKVLSQELAKPKYRKGVVVDGFPRTTQQAEWLASLYNKTSTHGKSMKFNFVMLYVNEEVSIERQLARGAAVRAQNSMIKNTGQPLQEERATDLCSIAAKVRYQGFIEKYNAIAETLEAQQFSTYVVDASTTVEAVQESLVSCLGSKSEDSNSSSNNNNDHTEDGFYNKNWHQQLVANLLDAHMPSRPNQRLAMAY